MNIQGETNDGHTVGWDAYFTIMAWWLWKSRNDRVFSNEHQTLEYKVTFLKKLWVENDMALNRSRSALPSCINIIVLVRWEVPPSG